MKRFAILLVMLAGCSGNRRDAELAEWRGKQLETCAKKFDVLFDRIAELEAEARVKDAKIVEKDAMLHHLKVLRDEDNEAALKERATLRARIETLEAELKKKE